MKFNNLKQGEILSESQFYKVVKIAGKQVQLENSSGENIIVDNKYVESCLNSADQFEKEVKSTKTELAEVLLSNPRTAMTVAFYKQDTPKTKKVFEGEKQAKIKEIQAAPVGRIESLLNDLVENPISKVIPGSLRVMKGRHNGDQDEFGRVSFIDMEVTTGVPTRVVDPRSIEYIITNKTKYTIK